MRRSITLSALAAFALALLTAAGTASASSVLVVDDDRAQCPDAEFTAIQSAVDAAAPGDEIVVCPGAYNERVTVAKAGLTLRAWPRTTHECFAAAPQPVDPAQEAIVSGGSVGVAFTLAADGVRLEGFVVRGSNTGIDTLQTVSGFRIKRNLVTGNVFGVRPGSSGNGLSRIAHNCFRENGFGPAGGGIAALVFPSPTGPRVLNNARVDHNEFFRNNFGIRLGASRDVTADHNVSREDSIWIRNGGVVDSSFIHNRIAAAALDGISFIPLGGSGAPNANVVVSHNEITGLGQDGIQATDPLASGGPALVDSLISHNAIVANGRDGIRLEAGAAAGNLVEHNALSGNAEHDCHDDTVGTGTGGTANTWENNTGATETRPSLCHGATVTAGP